MAHTNPTRSGGTRIKLIRTFAAVLLAIATLLPQGTVALAQDASGTATGTSVGSATVEGATTGSPAASDSSDNPVRIFLLDAPYLRWEDIGQLSTPRLYSILESSGMGNVICRSAARTHDLSVSANEAASSISGGYWREEPSMPNVSSGQAAAAEVGAEDLYAQDSEVVTYDNGAPFPGSIGQILEDNGWSTASLGCSDYDYRHVRPSVISMANAEGRVRFSCTDPYKLLDSAGALPYESTNVDTLCSQLDLILANIDSYSEQTGKLGNAVVAVDSGDLYRAGTYRTRYPGNTATYYWGQAVMSFDRVVGKVVDTMDENDVLIVYSPLSESTNTDHEDDGYGPLVVYGGGYDGVLSSSSTGRSGLVTALDISATILAACGQQGQIDNGTPLYCENSIVGDGGMPVTDVADIAAHLEYEADLADAIGDGQDLMNVLLCVLLFLAFGFSAVMLSTRIKLPARVADVTIIFTRLLWLVASAYPVSTYLMISLAPEPTSPADMVFLCIALTLALAVLAVAIGKITRRWLYSLLFLMGLTVAVLVFDQLTGAHMARVGFLSYQPVKLGRFTGIGNEGAAVLFGAWMMLAGLVLNRFPDLKISKVFAKGLFPVASLALLAVVIAPWWGSNFGALVWGVVGVFAAWWMFLGRRLTWKIVILTMLGCVGLVVLLILADGFTGQSHLGTTASSLLGEGLAYIPVIVGNMVRLSIATLFYSPLLSVFLAFLWLYLAWMRIDKPGPYKIFWERNGFFKSAFTASMVVAVVMLLVEDSGILLPALVLVYCTAGLTWLICDLHRWEFKQVEKDRGILDEDVDPPVGGFKIDEER